eukprot:835935-Pyramimonas_sp.AAC.1
MASVVLKFVWALATENPLFGSTLPEVSMREAACASKLTAELDGYFSSQRLLGNNPEVIDCLSMSMFKEKLKTKAGEARWLFRWCVEEGLPKFHGSLKRGQKLLECAQALGEWDKYL